VDVITFLVLCEGGLLFLILVVIGYLIYLHNKHH
jgi:hypothetical protein